MFSLLGVKSELAGLSLNQEASYIEGAGGGVNNGTAVDLADAIWR
jgi:hypothetical protein